MARGAGYLANLVLQRAALSTEACPAAATRVSPAAILTLALGLAAATTIFAIVNSVLLLPLPYTGADRLVSLAHTLVAGRTLQSSTDASLLFHTRHRLRDEPRWSILRLR